MDAPSAQARSERQIFLLGFALLVIGFLVYVFGDLRAPEAMTSSIYSYYQTNYYEKVSAGKIPWIHFPFEYPPLAAYALLFPAFVKGLSVFAVSVLRGLTCLLATTVSLWLVSRAPTIPTGIRKWICVGIGAMAWVVPGFYFGLFDWVLCVVNLLMAIWLLGRENGKESARGFWPIVFAGTAIKLMPILVTPFLYLITSGRERAILWKTAAVTFVIHLPFLIFGLSGLRNFVGYHRHRSIDNFSIYACGLETLERLGITSAKRIWNFGALEVQGKLAELMAKASLPLYLVALAGLVVLAHRLKDRRSAFALYSVAILLYPSISKVCQGNYVIWSVTSIVCLWICGFTNRKFMNISAGVIAAFLAVAWYQDSFFEANTLPLVPWVTILINSARHILTIGFAIYAIREIKRGPANLDLVAA